MSNVTTQYANNVETLTTSNPLSDTETAVSVLDVFNFPTLGAGEYFYATIFNADTLQEPEVIRVESIGGNTLNSVRGVDNTTAYVWPVGSTVTMRNNAGIYDEFRDSIASKADTTYVDSANGLQDATTAANTAAIANKADTTYVDSENGLQDVITAGKANTVDVLPLTGGTLTGALYGPSFNNVVITDSGLSSEYLSADGTYSAPAGGGGGALPGGFDKELQYNNNGVFGGTSNVKYANDVLSIISTDAQAVSNALYVKNDRTTSNTYAGAFYVNANNSAAVYGSSVGTSSHGVYGLTDGSGAGVYGQGGVTGTGVLGYAQNGYGVRAETTNGGLHALYAQNLQTSGSGGGIYSYVRSGSAWAGKFQNTDGTDTEVMLAGGADLIVGETGGVETFKVTDAGLVTGTSFNGVALTTTGSATNFLNEQGNYAAAGGGSGDVTKVGTPVDNQLGVWTGDGTIEGDPTLTYDTNGLKVTSSGTAANAVWGIANADSGLVAAGRFEQKAVNTHSGTGWGVVASSDAIEGGAIRASTNISATLASAIFASAGGTNGTAVYATTSTQGGRAGYFEHSFSTDEEVTLASDGVLILGAVEGTEKFKVTDTGATTALSFNGVSLTDAGAGTNFLSDDGTYKTPNASSLDFTIEGTSPQLKHHETDSTANEKYWTQFADGGIYYFYTGDDNGDPAQPIMAFTRGGLNPSSVRVYENLRGDSGITNTIGVIASSVANSASAIAHTLNVSNAYSTAGAKLLSVQNNAVEKFSIDKDGNVVGNAFNGVALTDAGAGSNFLADDGTYKAAGGGGGTPGGADTQLQYNNGGAFGGMAEWTYDDTIGKLSASASLTGDSLLHVTNSATTGFKPALRAECDALTGNGKGIEAVTLAPTGVAIFADAIGQTGFNYGIWARTLSATGVAGYFENTSGGDTKVTLCTDTDLIVGHLNTVERFKVTDAGLVTGTSFNGVALTDAGAGTNFLSDDGTYKAAGDGVTGGIDTQVQYNNGGALGGTVLAYNDITESFTLTSAANSGVLFQIQNSHSVGTGIAGIGATGVTGTSLAVGGAGMVASASAGSGFTIGIKAFCISPDGVAGYFENTNGTDTEVSLALGSDLIIGSVDGVEQFKVTGTGDVLGSAFTGVTYNGVALTSLGAGNLFLADDGVYKTVAGSGDVVKVGTPVDSQIGVWTGDGTIEGDASFLFDTTGDKLTVGNYTFNGGQTVGAGQDNYVLTYDNGTGEISLEAAAGGAEVNDLTASVTWANVPDVNITQSSVTQHEAALSIAHTQITGESWITSTLAATLNANSQDIDNIKTATFIAEVDNVGTTQTINWTAGQKQKTTITAATGVTFTAPAGPCNIMLKIINGGTGAITWPVTVLWPGGTEPTWTTTGTDICSFYYDGTTYYGMAGLGFA